jgi:aspartyl/glutamyl-tRNA(Asn/Gln) amidotransferase C subunit
MSKVDIGALAKLARLDIGAKEQASLQKEIPDILKFVEAIQGADISGVEEVATLHNVMREDSDPHEGGIYTEALLSQAPVREGDRVAVKQVVSRKKSAQGGSDSGGK